MEMCLLVNIIFDRKILMLRRFFQAFEIKLPRVNLVQYYSIDVMAFIGTSVLLAWLVSSFILRNAVRCAKSSAVQKLSNECNIK